MDVSIVDVANLFVFVEAKSLGLKGNETIEELDANSEARERLEAIRGIAAQKVGYVDNYQDAFEKTPAVPKIAIVAGPAGTEQPDLHVRMMSMKFTHKTFAVTGGMCVAAAAAIPGTIVNRIALQNPRFQLAQINVAHPGGMMDVGVNTAQENGEIVIKSTSGFSTARLLMEGIAYYPCSR